MTETGNAINAKPVVMFGQQGKKMEIPVEMKDDGRVLFTIPMILNPWHEVKIHWYYDDKENKAYAKRKGVNST